MAALIQSSTLSPFRILIVSHRGAPILKSEDLSLAIRKQEHSMYQISNLDFKSTLSANHIVFLSINFNARNVIFLINFLSKLTRVGPRLFLIPNS